MCSGSRDAEDGWRGRVACALCAVLCVWCCRSLACTVFRPLCACSSSCLHRALRSERARPAPRTPRAAQSPLCRRWRAVSSLLFAFARRSAAALPCRCPDGATMAAASVAGQSDPQRTAKRQARRARRATSAYGTSIRTELEAAARTVAHLTSRLCIAQFRSLAAMMRSITLAARSASARSMHAPPAICTAIAHAAPSAVAAAATPAAARPFSSHSHSVARPAAPSGPASAAAVKPPSRAHLIALYRALRRSVWQSFFTSSQYATYDELARDSLAIAGQSPGAAWRKAHLGLERNRAHVEFADKRSAPWLALIKSGFEAAVAEGERDPASLVRSYRHADELLQLLRANMEHSRYLLEGGWGLRRDTHKQLSNVAKVVGLAMPKPTEGEADPKTFAGAKHAKARDAKLGKHDKFVR